MKELSDTRIVFITHYTALYGANRSLLNLIDGLSNSGINDLLIISPFHGKITEELAKRNIEYKIIPFVNETHVVDEKITLLKKIAKFVYNWYIVVRYSKFIRSEGSTLIHSNSSATLIGAYFSFWLCIPHVWHVREFGTEDYKLKYNFGYKYYQYWLDKSQAVVAISKAVYDKRVKYCKASIKQVIYNGVVFLNELNKREIKKCNEQQKSNITFGIIGVISKEKGQVEAIEAFKLLHNRYRNTFLIIAGEGEDEYVQHLKEKVNKDGLGEWIYFSGFIETPENFYKQINCLLMCSRNEGLGRVTIEAMSYSVPVIGYKNGGTTEIIQHKHNGLLYTNGSVELSEMMLLMINDKSMQQKMKINAINTVKGYFTIDKYTRSIYKIYKDCIYTQ